MRALCETLRLWTSLAPIPLKSHYPLGSPKTDYRQLHETSANIRQSRVGTEPRISPSMTRGGFGRAAFPGAHRYFAGAINSRAGIVT
jgi:hypothetical protein